MEEQRTGKWSGVLALQYNKDELKQIMVRDKYGKWGLPGGGQRVGELPIETAIRESEEETKISLDRKTLKQLATGIDQVNLFYTFIEHYRGRQIKDDDEIVESRLFTIKQALKLDLKLKDKIILEMFSSIATNRIIELLRESFESEEIHS